MLDLRKRLSNSILPYINKLCKTDSATHFTVPPQNKYGNFALPCFIIARESRSNPAIIAKELSRTIQANDLIKGVSHNGPYLNFNLNTNYMLYHLIKGLHDNNAFIPFCQTADREHILIEYSQPNTHKLFHIGHIRNVAIGDSLCRILKYNNHHITAINYIGDIGSHIAKFLWYINKTDIDLSSISDGTAIGNIYTQSVKYFEALEDNAKFTAREEISKVQMKLEDRSCTTLLGQWHHSRKLSIDYFNEIYTFLNAGFDKFYYESEVEQDGISMVKDLYAKKVLKMSRGAIVAELNGNLGVFLLLKSDGTSLYATKEIALAFKKSNDFNYDKSYYIVGSEQTLYFKQLFETLKLIGFQDHDKLQHLPYELVSLQDEKMSSRYGNIVSFHDLKNSIYDTIKNTYLVNKDWGTEKRESILYRIALATIRYGMVSKALNKKIIFNLEQWLKPEGDTGAYVLYTIARINSILNKSMARTSNICIDRLYHYDTHEAEDKLMIMLCEFSYTVKIAQDRLDPSILANYIFDLCKALNRFYHQMPVMQAEADPFTFRYYLLYASKEILQKGISLLGFYPVSEM